MTRRSQHESEEVARLRKELDGEIVVYGSRRFVISSVYTDDMTERALQEPTFLILTALAGGPQHGYGIIGDVDQISDGRVRLRAGTLYAALDRLQQEGLIEIEREEVVDARLRRYYQLSDKGTRRLSAEVERLRRNAKAASHRLRTIGSRAFSPRGSTA